MPVDFSTALLLADTLSAQVMDFLLNASTNAVA
jgi:hypothetical protein